MWYRMYTKIKNVNILLHRLNLKLYHYLFTNIDRIHLFIDFIVKACIHEYLALNYLERINIQVMYSNIVTLQSRSEKKSKSLQNRLKILKNQPVNGIKRR